MQSAIILVGLPFPNILTRVVPVDAAVILGRSSECDLVVDHASISRRHAELSVRSGTFRVVDLDSKNGTFVNDVRLANVGEVTPGQRVKFGIVSFVALPLNQDSGEVDSELDTDGPHRREGPQTAISEVDQLSAAQKRVFSFLVDGMAEKRIATRLGISRFTVHNHVSAIYRAFGVHSRPELLVRALSIRKDR